MVEQQQLTIAPTPLEVHGDKVEFTLSAYLPAKMMKKDVKYTLDVAYVTGDNEEFIPEKNSASSTPIGTIEFDGNLYENSKQAAVITKKMAFKYQKHHKKGYLVVYGTLTKGEVSKTFAPQRLQNEGKPVKGVSTTSRLVRSPLDGVSNATGRSPFAYAHTNWKIENPLVKEYNINFNQGSAKILASTSNNQQTLDLMREAFKNMATQFADPLIIPHWTISSTSSHSPEGRLSVNRDLPRYRLNAMGRQVHHTMNLFRYGNRQMRFSQELDHKILEATWPEFKFLVQNSKLTQDQKTEVVAIIDDFGAFAEKEKKLQELNYYPQIIKEIYPKMRYAKMSIATPNVIRTKAYLENLLSKIIKGTKKATLLSEDEYLFMVKTTTSYTTRVTWLEKAVVAYGSWRVLNNLGAAYLDLALLTKENQYIDKALESLGKALLQKESGEIYYNLGMVYLMKKNQKKALEYFNKAIKIGGGSNQPFIGLLQGIQGYKTIQMAKSRHDGYYQKTYQALESATSNVPNYFNMGLAYLLEGLSYDKAQQSFEAAVKLNPKDALSYYALAIVAARTSQPSLVNENLQKAVSLQSDLRGQAWQDAEFFKYNIENLVKVLLI